MNNDIQRTESARDMQAQRTAQEQARRDHHRYHAAYHLYHAVKPQDGLEWPDLSPDQRKEYYALVDQAIGFTDKTQGVASAS